MRWMAAVATLALTAGAARAEPEGVNDKSLGAALGLSVGGTALGLATAVTAWSLSPDHPMRDLLFATGGTMALVMPTAGHWYARGKVGGGTAGSWVRFAGGCLATVGGILHLGRDDSIDGYPHFARGVMYGGLVMLAGGALLDIALVASSVRRANRRPNKAIDITLLPSSGGGGVVVSGKF